MVKIYRWDPCLCCFSHTNATLLPPAFAERVDLIGFGATANGNNEHTTGDHRHC